MWKYAVIKLSGTFGECFAIISYLAWWEFRIIKIWAGSMGVSMAMGSITETARGKDEEAARN